VNELVDEGERPIDILVIGPETEGAQIRAVQAVRQDRDREKAERGLEVLKAAAATDENLMPALVACARAYCTEGEIVDALRLVFGEYTETPRF
jgi:methylmalonyl-CoA mutase N-terminal domain/subunit